MENLIESIRIAVAADASDEHRAAGLHACRTIAAALEPTPSQALTASAQVTTPPLAQMLAVLQGVPPEQLLDLAIARLRAALPTESPALAVTPLRFHLVPVSRS